MTLQKTLWMRKVTYPARLDRQLISDLFAQGVKSLADMAPSVTGATLQSSIAAGPAYVTGTHNANQGTYRAWNDAAVNFTHDAAVANPRWDKLILRIYDSDESGTGADTAAFELLKGSENALASLTNKAGIASTAGIASFMEIADILIPVGAGSPIPAANVADMRKIAGQNSLIVPLAVRNVLEVGVAGQTRAGRVFVVSDFTDLGLGVPVGLWNLSNENDVSGNGRHLTNKGSVPFGKGITGNVTEAAVFAGSTAQALWRAHEAALSPIMGGDLGWFQTTKRGTSQTLCSKLGGTNATSHSVLSVNASNNIEVTLYFASGASRTLVGVKDVADGRFHYVGWTYDGTTLCLYVDWALEASVTLSDGPLNTASTAVYVIGGRCEDNTATTISLPFYGRIDEWVRVNEVLSEDQIRCLAAVKLTHSATRSPRKAGLCVRRRRRGSALAVADFTALSLAQPDRLYNLANALTDLGSDATNLTSNGGASGTGIAGPDGLLSGAYHFDGTDDYLSATDAGLPSGTAARTLLVWFKTIQATQQTIISYGAANETMMYVDSSGTIKSYDGAGSAEGPFVRDGLWHFGAMVFSNTASDGVKNKLYLDGRFVAGLTTLASAALSGSFRIGSRAGSVSDLFKGQIARVAMLSEAMTSDQIAAIYAKGSQDLGLSPYSEGEYVERLTDSGVYVLADRPSDPNDPGMLQDVHQIELAVSA